MSETLIYTKPGAFVTHASERYPGTRAFAAYASLYGAGAMPCDRTGTIRTPLRTKALFPIPAFRKFEQTLEAVCAGRARELIARANAFDCDMFILWSGGIDSTLALVSLLKESTDADRARFVVLLSEYSISENPRFFDAYIRGTLRVDTATRLPEILGTRHLVISGEHNDQLFGSDIMAPLIRKHGTNIIHAPYEREILREHFLETLGSGHLSDFYVELFERLPAASPTPIVSLFDFTWWINFSLKWQTVYARTLTFTKPENASNITDEYLRNFYAPFYNTDEFQLWSMNNPDKRIKDTWASYKWPCKDIIYDFTKDEVYRDTKLKMGSLGAFMQGQHSFTVLDSTLVLHEAFDPSTHFNPLNDFVAAEASMA